MSIRDIKRSARRDLHREMAVPALYLVPDGDGWLAPVPCTVRLHTKFQALGDAKGTNFHYAEREEETPKAVLLRDDVSAPTRGCVISVEAGEAYRIDHAAEPDDEFVTVTILRLAAEEAVGLPVP